MYLKIYRKYSPPVFTCSSSLEFSEHANEPRCISALTVAAHLYKF